MLLQGEQTCHHEKETENLVCTTPTLITDDQLPVNVSLRLLIDDVTNGSDYIFFPLSQELRSVIFVDPVIYGFRDEDSLVDRVDIDINKNILVIWVSLGNIAVLHWYWGIWFQIWTIKNGILRTSVDFKRGTIFLSIGAITILVYSYKDFSSFHLLFK